MKNSFFLFSPILFLVLFFRASLDPILNLTKIGGMGLGALLNLLIVALFMVILFKNKAKIPLSYLKIWGVFLLFGIISIAASPTLVTSLRSFFSVLTYFSVFAIPFYFIKTKSDLLSILRLVIYSSAIPLLVVFKEFAMPAASTTKDGFRLFATFSHPNIFAFYLVLISSLCFFCLKSKSISFERKFLLHVKVILFWSIICLLLTKTRSAWLALILVFSVYGAICERRYILYLCLLGAVAMLIPSVQERVLDMFAGQDMDVLDEGGTLNSLAWRKVVWAASWDYIINKPFSGHGYNTFAYYFLEFFPLEENKGFDAHNAYVQIAFDMGFLGVLGYIMIFIFILKRFLFYLQFDKQGISILLGLVLSYMLVSYSDNMLFYLSYNWYFWLILGAFYYLPVKELSMKSEVKNVYC